MANFLNSLRAKRDAGEISTSNNNGAPRIKITGEGHFTAKLVAAEWGKNRAGTAERGKLTFQVLAVRKDTTDVSQIGTQFSEYFSCSNEEVANRKYLELSDWMLAAGVKAEKLVDEDDDVIDEAMRTLVLAASKYAGKKDIVVDLYRKQSDKLAENGKPYYNNYFDGAHKDDSAALGLDDDAPVAQQSPYKAAQTAPAPTQVDAKQYLAPKTEAPKASAHAAAVEDED